MIELRADLENSPWCTRCGHGKGKSNIGDFCPDCLRTNDSSGRPVEVVLKSAAQVQRDTIAKGNAYKLLKGTKKPVKTPEDHIREFEIKTNAKIDKLVGLIESQADVLKRLQQPPKAEPKEVEKTRASSGKSKNPEGGQK
jgi:hypothetical protein